MGLLAAFIDWWRRRHWTQPRFVHVRMYESRADVPRRLPRRAVAVVTGQPGWAIFECPCGTGHERIELLLTPRNGLPSWDLTADDAGPSIRPSVDYVDGRRCHFWLREGRVRWV